VTRETMPIHDGVFITCAITGSGYTAHKSDKVPVTPAQIADSCIEAAKAGAAVVHIHVREDDGMPSRSVEKYEEVAERVRSSDTDVVLNLTAGMGGDLILGDVEKPLPAAVEGTDMAGATERVEHVRRIRPEICTLDCGSISHMPRILSAGASSRIQPWCSCAWVCRGALPMT